MKQPLRFGNDAMAHDLKQPLNVIQLAADNIRRRIVPALAPAEAEYLIGKLDRIEQQIARAAALLDQSKASETPHAGEE